MPIGAVVLAGFGGSLLLPIITVAYHFIFFRETQSDGQYTIVLLIASMQGAMLGCLAGLVFAIWTTGKRRLATQVAKYGGWSFTLLLFFLGWTVFSGTEGPTVGERVNSTLFWSLLPMLGSIALTRFHSVGGSTS